MLVTQALLSKGWILVGEQTPGASTPEQACTTALEALQLGYLVDPQDLTSFTPTQHSELLAAIAQIIGRNENWKPMYAGFPEEVIHTDEVELWLNAFVHYVTYGEWLPDAEKEFERAHLQGTPRYPRIVRVVLLQTKLLTDLWEKPIALGRRDIEVCRALAEALGTDSVRELYNATTFINGENLATATEITRDLAAGLAKARNADQILRVVLALYCENPDRSRDLLAHKDWFPVRLTAIPRSARRAILAALHGADPDLVWKRRKLWRMVMRKIHPYDFAERPQEIVDLIHAKKKPPTFNSQVEAALGRGDVGAALELLVQQPGNLIRRTAHLMRLSVDYGRWRGLRPSKQQPRVDQLIAALEEHGPKVRLTTLISALNALRNREARYKVVRLPSNRTVLWTPDDESVPDDIVARVIAAIEGAILQRLRRLPAPEGPVAVIAPEPVELVERYQSETLDDLARGQRLPLTGPIVRLFVHWEGKFDVDLGVVVANSALTKELRALDWTNIGERSKDLVHSGDIITAPEGAAEFVDADMVSLASKRNHRYLIANVISFSGQHFAEVPNYCGAMDRSAPMSGEIFEPTTVATGMRSRAGTTSLVPFVVDLVEQELIWLDSSMGTLSGGYSTKGSPVVNFVHAELAAISTAFTNGELLALWAQAHGVDTTEQPNEEARELVAGLLKESV